MHVLFVGYSNSCYFFFNSFFFFSGRNNPVPFRLFLARLLAFLTSEQKEGFFVVGRGGGGALMLGAMLIGGDASFPLSICFILSMFFLGGGMGICAGSTCPCPPPPPRSYNSARHKLICYVGHTSGKLADCQKQPALRYA